MNQDIFQLEKRNALSKADKSKKGGIDDAIKGIVGFINSLTDYYTTSSCVGRIVLLETGLRRKIDSSWLLSSHDKITLDELKKKLAKFRKREIWLRQESWILHVACRNLESASKLLYFCHSIGLKRSGIISLRKRIMIEIRSTEIISMIIASTEKILVDDDCLREIVEHANNNLVSARERLIRFEEKIREEF